MEKLLYRVDEACVVTGLGRTKIYDEIVKGRLRVVHFGKSVRIPADELRAYVDRAKQASGLADNLLGKWAHVLNDDGAVERQGRILKAVGPAAYLVQWYEWLGGEASTVGKVCVDEIGNGTWILYDTDDEMRSAYEARQANRGHTPSS